MSHEISLSGQTISVEIANTDASRYTGLSEKEDLSRNEGMLFNWPTEKQHGLVMRDMNFGIDMVFADAEGTVTKIHSTGPNGDGASALSKFAVELPRGWCQKVGVENGDTLELTQDALGKSDRGTESLRKTIAGDWWQRVVEKQAETDTTMEETTYYDSLNETTYQITNIEDGVATVQDEAGESWDEKVEHLEVKVGDTWENTEGRKQDWQEKEDDPCWENYEQQGMKEGDNGEKVPNCVPKSLSDNAMSDEIAEKTAERLTDLVDE